MKLIRFASADDPNPRFGAVVGDHAVAFAAMPGVSGFDAALLESVESYLGSLPASEALARRMLEEWDDGQGGIPIAEARILAPVPNPAALLDFGLTPKHLMNSAATLIRYEYGRLAAAVVMPILRRRLKRMLSSPALPYYKGNHREIVGNGDEVGWPSYASYVDIEPELAFVVGTPAQPIAGYLIYNDMSARDVQMPEMTAAGPARSKDFRRGNGLGPYLVTADEVGDPRALAVAVRVIDRRGQERFAWRGHTSEYVHPPERILEFLEPVFTPAPSTVIGMGTVPDCTGLDNDRWIEPGDEVFITFDRLGTLHQRIPEQLPPLDPSRWPARRL